MAIMETAIQDILSPDTGSPTTLIFRSFKSKTPLMTPNSTPESSVIIIDLEQKAIHESIKDAQVEKGPGRESTSNAPSKSIPGNHWSEEIKQMLTIPEESFILVDRGVDSEPERVPEIVRRIVESGISRWQQLARASRVDHLLNPQQILVILNNIAGQPHLQERGDEWIHIESAPKLQTVRRLEDSESLLTA